jgi:superfamily II DNA or RNA helicase
LLLHPWHLVQAACVPLALAGRDICGSAVTGSGKTAAFGLPLLERLLHRNKRVAATYVLVLTPVRELAVQASRLRHCFLLAGSPAAAAAGRRGQERAGRGLVGSGVVWHMYLCLLEKERGHVHCLHVLWQ